jgi:hypothetical protein
MASEDLGYEDFFSVVGPRFLKMEAAGAADVKKYIEILKGRQIRLPLHGVSMFVAQFVEPIDPVLGQTEGAPAGNTFFNASVLAVRAANRLIAPGEQKRMCDLNAKLYCEIVEDTNAPLSIEKCQEVAKMFTDIAEEGWMYMRESYEPLIDQWEDVISRDIRQQPYIRKAFGHIGYLAHTAQQEALKDDLARMAVEFDAGVPEQEFDRFLGEL